MIRMISYESMTPVHMTGVLLSLGVHMIDDNMELLYCTSQWWNAMAAI